MHLFTDDEKILSKLSEKGNPLERLDAVMNWNIFLPLLSELFSRK
ncbi:IS5/IS1182 family transposase, partial [Streptococcus suis]|nr:IS5/IS1182 family transposase [Streptococcus suis]